MSEVSSLNLKTLTMLLQALADPALTHLKTDDLSHAVLRCLREIMAADNLAILLLTEDHTALRIHAVLGVEEIVARDVHIPVGRGFAGQIVTQGVPLIVHDPSPLEIMTPLLREQLRSLLGVPLIVRQQVIGVLHVGMKREYLFTDEDIDVLQRVAHSLTQAFERTLQVKVAHYEVEELIDAQLSAVEELIEQQQLASTELLDIQQRAAIELVGAQQRAAIEMVGAQQCVAIELMGQQQQMARELLEQQLQTARGLAGQQLQTSGELAEQQQQTALELAEQQQQIARELMEQQQQMARELLEQQQQVVRELLEQQQQIARELMEQQQKMRLNTLERIKELEAIFNAITDAVIVYDKQGNTIRSNRAARYFLDAEKSSIEQKTPHPLRDEDGNPFSSERLPLQRLLDGERIGAKQTVTAYLHTLDQYDIQLSITGTPLHTQQGDLYGAVCVLHDVTKRKRMERRTEILEVLLQMIEFLVKSSTQKEQMLTQDDSAQAIQQIENTIVVLAQRLLGCSHAIIIGIDQRQMLSPLALAGFSTEQEQRLRSALTGALLSQLITDPDTRKLLEGQDMVPFTITQSFLLAYVSPLSSSPNCHLVPIRVADQLIGLLGIVFPEGAFPLDAGEKTVLTAISRLCALALQYEQQTIERDLLITARLLLNEQMQHLNKMQSDFIAVVSHEFRTALTTIEGFSDLLRSEDFSDEEVKNYANDIYTDALRLHRMVTDLLDVEQMKQGKMPMQVGEVDMNALLTMITNRTGLVSPHHTLHLSLDETLPHLEGDPDKLIQVITNLLSNAIKYSPMGGEILITSCREGNSVHVSIQDQGLGIASGSLENIFTPYHRSNSASTYYIQGTGLGLALVREIISLHQGTIWVESTLGHGSTFHFSLPCTSEMLPLSSEKIPLKA